MSAQIAFDWKGEQLQFQANGSLYLPDYDVLVISDLHLEKGASQQNIVPLPSFDTPDTLQRAEKAIAQTGAKHCIFLGDSFHTTETAWRLPAQQRALIQNVADKCELYWVEGNHDPDLPHHIPGHHCAEISIGPFKFRHMPAKEHHSEFEVFGHYHPKAKLRLRAKHVSGKCFLLTDTKLLMPAFGSYTGGLNIKEPVISTILPRGKQVFFCYQQKIYHLPYSAQNFI